MNKGDLNLNFGTRLKVEKYNMGKINCNTLIITRRANHRCNRARNKSHQFKCIKLCTTLQSTQDYEYESVQSLNIGTMANITNDSLHSYGPKL